MPERSPLTEINSGSRLQAVTFTANGEHLVSGHEEGVRVWQVGDGKQVATMPTSWSVWCIAVSRNGKWIAAGTWGGEVVLWDAETYEKVFSRREDDACNINGIDFSPDSARLLVASDNCIATVWDVAIREQVLGPFLQAGWVIAARYSPQGDQIATATQDSVRVYDGGDGRLLMDIQVNVTRWFNGGLVWSSDHLFIVSDDEFKQIDVSTGSVVSGWRVPDPWCLALPLHGEFVAYSTRRNVVFRDMSAHNELGLVQYPGNICSLAFSLDGRLLAIGGEEGKITIKNLSRTSEPEIHIDDGVLDSWNHGQLVNTQAELIVASGDPSHVLASRALAQARLQYWDAAIISAEKSIELQPSVIGYTAKSLALIGIGKKHEAYRTCDIAFEHFHPTHVTFLLLIKAIIVFMAGECDDAISRVDDLIATVPFNSTCYVVQARAYMHLLVGNLRMENNDYEGAIQSFEHAKTKAQHGSRPPLVVSLISGWKFDDFSVTIRQRLCEALYGAGRIEDARESLLQMVDTFEEEVYASGTITKWVSAFTHICLSTPENDDDIDKAARHDSMPTALSESAPSTLLEWAKATLMVGSWKDAMLSTTDFIVPRSMIYRVICERLETMDHTLDASECFHELWSDLAQRTDMRNGEQQSWVLDFKLRCCKNLEAIGDAAANTQQPELAITHYSAVLLLGPANLQDIFIKRSKAHVTMGLWKDALDDLSHVIASNTSSGWDYETVLTEWTKVTLADASWKDALVATTDFAVPRFMVYRVICERLETMGRILDATECFCQMTDELVGETESEEHAKWFLDFKLRCREKHEHLGDVAMNTQRHNEAITHYSAAMSLNPDFAYDLLIKRSKARVASKLWEDAMNDVNEAIGLDPSLPWGYETKHAVLHATGHYLDAVDMFEMMRSKLAQSSDPDICERLGQYISPSNTRAAIRRIVQRTVRHFPRIIIDTSTGFLHSKAEQVSAFESLPVFNELVSSMTTRIDRGRIKREVRQYFRYAMLSHRWEENEPLFRQVIQKAVYDLEGSPTHDKLKMFCIIARDAGFNWAWSDTCCINKQDHFVLQEALVAMFKWYRGSSMMIVFLRGVRSPAEFGDLVGSIWNTRAWTFQEYVAAKVIRFYTEDWTPYLDLRMPNHKESPQIISEMEQATGVSAQQLMALRPGLSSIREKLRLASTRETTLIEDAAYALLGIFSVAGIPAIYGEGEGALGRLLAHILAGSGDTSILAWSGQCSSYNSCLPARITVYSRPAASHLPPPLSDSEMESIVSTLRASSLDMELALKLHDRLHELSAPWFAASRMKLPCISFKLPPLSAYRARPDRVYRVDTAAFGVVEIKTRQDLSRLNSLYLIHPWLDTLLHREDTQITVFMEDDVAEPFSPGTDDEDISDEEIGDDDIDDDSSSLPEPVSLPHHVPMHSVPTDRETGALQLIARLRQPFGALLFTLAQTAGRRREEYRRVAADSIIAVQVQENIPLDELIENVRTLDVL